MAARLGNIILALLLAALSAGRLFAQPPSPPPSGETGPPILQYLFAIAALGLILTILMMPTRKN